MLRLNVVASINDIPTTAAEKLVYLYSKQANKSRLFLNDDSMVSIVEQMLNAIYAEEPSIESDGYSPWIGHELNYLTLVPITNSTLYGELNSINKSVDGYNFSTGIDAFDTIHEKAVLSSITRQRFYSWDDWFVLRYENGWINLEEMIRRYSAPPLEGEIAFVETNGWIGGGSGLEMELSAECTDKRCWTFSFTKRWGDCPSGCIHSSTSSFTVTEDSYTVIDARTSKSQTVDVQFAMFALFVVSVFNY